MKLENYIAGKWITGDGEGQPLYNAVTGEPIASASTKGLDLKQMLEYGRAVGNPALRRMTFHERGNMLKALAMHLRNHLDLFHHRFGQVAGNRGGLYNSRHACQ